MFRPKKKKELSLMEKLKELELLEEGEMVDIPDLENDDLIEENSLSVIVRCLNPAVHKVGGLVKALPPIWGLEDRVHGRGVGADRVQFIFQSDRDLHHVLTRGPWFVNGWIVSLDQWSPSPSPDFLHKILFWIRVRGLPVHLLKKQAVDSLIGPLGKIEKVELHAKNSTSVEYIRAQVWINTDEPLQFRRTARFKSREVIPTELEYERLIKVCFLCKHLTHDQTKCPYQVLPQEQHQNVAVPRRSNQAQGGSLRKDQQGGQNSKATVKAPRTTHSRATQSRATSRRETIPAAAPYRKTSQKGKDIAGESSRVWKQKEIVKTPRLEGTNSKSTGESSIPIGRKSNSSGKRSVPCSRATSPPEANRDLVSVFERLGNAEPNSPCIAEHDRAAEARSSHSKDSSNHKESQEGRSSKGSRSPPSVFERLGSHSQNTAEGTKNLREVLSSKRRRLNNSGDREAKKPRTETHEASVFQRLGTKGSGSGEKSVEVPVHSAQVAATRPRHSVRRIVLGSGKILEEGLMDNSNPSKSI
ncbi:uncharacterized protein LOC125580229 [Brassica napus]|uniref:uncharacterized protein LOC125580229 n=1 Tax=Brassica napus TaxID=3708 RepID=UPI00207865BA|nr:uncharacterized protein LOC125580229 [Brassica napus]